MVMTMARAAEAVATVAAALKECTGEGGLEAHVGGGCIIGVRDFALCAFIHDCDYVYMIVHTTGVIL